MDWPDSSSYQEWDPEKDGAWLRHGKAIPPGVTAEVKPLTTDYAARLWRWVFGSSIEVLPLLAKEKAPWLAKVFASTPIRFGGREPSLQQQLSQSITWPEADIVFFLTRCGTGYESSWANYLRHCERFLGWYDEGLLFHPTAREVAVFWEVPAVFVGRRSKRKLSR